MIQEFINADLNNFKKYARAASIAGWFFLAGAIFMALFTIYQFIQAYSFDGGIALLKAYWGRIYGLSFTTASIGMMFLMLGQMLKYKMGLQRPMGWFFRNGHLILRGYAVIVIAERVIIYASRVFHGFGGQKEIRFHIPFRSDFPVAGLTFLFFIAKIILLFWLAGVVKMMIDEIHSEGYS